MLSVHCAVVVERSAETSDEKTIEGMTEVSIVVVALPENTADMVNVVDAVTGAAVTVAVRVSA
jgi:hypothetical protein